MAKTQWGPDRRLARMMLLGMLILAGLGTLMAVAGCSERVPTPRDMWVDQHPIHYNEDGDCIEADGEPCDEDPYDLNDFFELERKKASPQVTKTPGAVKSSAKPSTKPRSTPRR